MAKKAPKAKVQPATGIGVAFQVKTSAPPHRIKFESEDATLGSAPVPAFENFPDVLVLDGKGFRLSGRAQVDGEEVVTYSEVGVALLDPVEE